MARSTTKDLPTAQPKGDKHLPTSWEDTMARAAEEVATAEAKVGASRWFSIRGGILSLGGNPLPDKQMDVVVLDSVFERAYYPDGFDPDEPRPPVCFAFSRSGDDMAPHEESIDKQHDTCKGCPRDGWGTAVRSDGKRSKGKACKEIRRLATIPMTALEDPKYVAQAEWAGLKVPVTSVAAWANYAKSVAASFKRPPFGVVTRIGVQPDPKVQVRVTFQAIQSIKSPVVGQAVLAKRESILEDMTAPYQAREEEPEPVKPARGSARRKY